MTKRGHLAGADFIRALACIMVLTHHLVLRLDLDRLSPHMRPVFETLRFGSYGVALFFVLSGFLLSLPFWAALDRGADMPSLKIYAMRRAARVLPGFWLALTTGFILSFAVYDATLNSELLGRYLAGFFLMSQWHWRTFFPVQGDGPLWSIPFEATCYVLLPIFFAVVFSARSRFGRPIGQCILWVALIGLVLLGHWLIVSSVPMDEIGRGWNFGMQGGAKEWMPRYNPIGFFAIFAIGGLAAGIHTILPLRRSTLFDLLALAALIAAAAQLPLSLDGPWEGYGWLGIPYRFPLLPLAVATALCALPRSKLLGALLDGSVTRFIATISFGIYIWQDIVISLIKQLFPESFGNGSDLSGWFGTSAIAIAVLLFIASASYFLLEKPIIDWAKGLEGRRRLLPAADPQS